MRGAIHRRVRRVRAEFWGILQTTVAAGSAWALASLLHPHPYFAPAAAVIALGVSRGGRTIRAIELTAGVAVGILVADVIVRALGANTLVLMLVVALSMAAALLLGAGAILVNQAAISGILIVATLQPGASPSPSRFLDALIGGAVALLVGQVLFPRDPVRAMAKAARPVVSDLSVALKALAEALRDGDEQRARRALEIARHTDDDLASFFDAVALARETFTLRHPRGRTRERVPLYAEAAQQMDYAVRNTRVLARRALSAVRRYGPAPPELADAVALLGDAVLELGNQLEHPERDTAARGLALQAAVKATRLLQDDPGAVDQRHHRPGPLDGDRPAARVRDDGRGGPHRPGRRRRARGRSAVAEVVPSPAPCSSLRRNQPQEAGMSRVIVIEFLSLDGVMEDPDGRGGSDHGGWAFRYGPAAVAGDKFKLGEVLDAGALLLGRATWQLFAGIWPRQGRCLLQRDERHPQARRVAVAAARRRNGRTPA